MGSLPVDKMEGPYSARLPSSSFGEKSRRASVGRGTAEERQEKSANMSGPAAQGGPRDFAHEPVMISEILAVFEAAPAGVLLDATLGGAGHAAAILDARDDLSLVGLDQDPTAVRVARDRLGHFGDRAQVRHARFDDLARVLDDLGVELICGVLFDLGVSSHQLDEAERGFSFRNDGPLDMRMNPTLGRSAADLVNTMSEQELADILWTHGDERHSRRIARAILAARPITTTFELAQEVSEAMPARSRRSPGHPARRTFQALRIAVNDELEVLEPSLVGAIERMMPGGRGVVLSYHSGEDRIVKGTLRRLAGLDQHVPAGLPVPDRPSAIELLHRGGRTASAAEVEANPRASSARMRSFVRTDEVAA
jgi:16S rRNA (cytosine1402-N4)-methyltransferase